MNFIDSSLIFCGLHAGLLMKVIKESMMLDGLITTQHWSLQVAMEGPERFMIALVTL